MIPTAAPLTPIPIFHVYPAHMAPHYLQLSQQSSHDQQPGYNERKYIHTSPNTPQMQHHGGESFLTGNWSPTCTLPLEYRNDLFQNILSNPIRHS